MRRVATISRAGAPVALCALPALASEELADHEQAEAVLLARRGGEEDASVAVAPSGPRAEGGAALQHELLEAAEADGDAGEIAAVGEPEIAEMARHGRQQLEIDQLERQPAGALRGEEGGGAGEVALHHDAAERGDVGRGGW